MYTHMSTHLHTEEVKCSPSARARARVVVVLEDSSDSRGAEEHQTAPALTTQHLPGETR